MVGRPAYGQGAPTMVDTKMARTLHAWRVSSAGQGITKRMIKPTATARAAVLKLAGCSNTSPDQRAYCL